MNHLSVLNAHRFRPAENLHQRLDDEPRVAQVPAQSVAEIRRQMSRERERELAGYESARAGSKGAERRELYDRTPLNDALHGSPPKEDYFSMREKRRAEERQYRGQMQRNPEMGEYTSDYSRRRLRWGEDPSDNRQVRFRVDNDSSPYNTRNRTQRWDEEERELIEWAKSQGNLNDGKPRNRALTPPTYESPQKKERDKGQKSLRSISAPVVAEGIAALGMRDSSRTKQMRQKQYAEELRAQIREKEKAKQREKLEELVAKPGNIQGSNTTDKSKNSPEIISMAPKHNTVRVDEHDERGYRERGRRSRREVFSQRPPPSPSHYPDRRYSPYPPPHGYYPSYDPYHNHPPPWVPPYYHPPYAYPHMEYPLPPPPPPPNPYYNLQLQMDNPYLPPRRLEPWEDRYEHRERREVERSDVKKPLLEKEEDRFLRKSGTDDDSEEFTSPLTGRLSHSRNLKQTKASYRAELEKQMLERKERETKKLAEKEKFDLEKAVEIYDPWGKGGCGAPVRDDKGNLVADLKRMRKLNDERIMGTSPQRPQSTTASGGAHTHSGATDTSPQKSPYTYDKQNVEEQKKVNQEVYRDFLRQQVEEKEAIKRREKEQKRIEEQRESERLAQERKKLQEDYAREQEAQRRKEEEIRAKNEAIKREAELKRREAVLKKQQEESEKEREEMNRSLSERVEQFCPQPRTKSPPVPTLQRKLNQGYPPPRPPSRPVSSNLLQPQSSSPLVPPALQHKLMHQQAPPYLQQEPAAPRSSSPPVPALRNKAKLEARPDPPRATTDTGSKSEEHGETNSIAEHKQQESQSSDVLRELSAMRKHLLSEHNKLTKNQHRNHKDADTTGHTSGDIFNMAIMQKPRTVAPRTKPLVRAGPKNSAISSALRDFATLRQHTHQREFLEQFPTPPFSEASFAAQQDALLTHQEQMLAKLRNSDKSQKENRPAVPLHSERDNLLSSYSTQVPLNVGNVFSDGPVYSEDQRPQVARGRRQWQGGSTLHPPPRASSAGGQSEFSVATLDIDSMARRNEERMRRLDAILNASAGNTQNPQTILDNFLKRRTDKSHTFSDMKGGSRRSERSLECETNFHPIPSAHT